MVAERCRKECERFYPRNQQVEYERLDTPETLEIRRFFPQLIHSELVGRGRELSALQLHDVRLCRALSRQCPDVIRPPLQRFSHRAFEYRVIVVRRRYPAWRVVEDLIEDVWSRAALAQPRDHHFPPIVVPKVFDTGDFANATKCC